MAVQRCFSLYLKTGTKDEYCEYLGRGNRIHLNLKKKKKLLSSHRFLPVTSLLCSLCFFRKSNIIDNGEGMEEVSSSKTITIAPLPDCMYV